MKTAERIIISAIFLALIGAVYWGYSTTKQNRTEFRDRVAAGEFEIRDEPITAVTPSSTIPESEWRRYYPVTYSMRVGDAVVQASVADTLATRIQGLSDTPYLPDGVVKLFAFGAPGAHSIWMKNMNYPLDIIWAAEDGTIVHIEEDVSPDTYDAVAPQNSQSFKSPVDSWFVVEANAGFVDANEVEVGDIVMIPRGE